eukprot:15314647-Alexandrium_andersonii.AAC.1
MLQATRAGTSQSASAGLLSGRVPQTPSAECMRRASERTTHSGGTPTDRRLRTAADGLSTLVLTGGALERVRAH